MRPLLAPSVLPALQAHASSAPVRSWTCGQCRQYHHHLNHERPKLPLSSRSHINLSTISPSTPRAFSTSPTTHLEDHYATLNLPPTASQADIKKAFYTLSKTHHPDRNPTNQEAASQKFVACSDAYAILGNPTKRQKYDRERHPTPAHYAAPQHGSYSSAQAGGRPASGLSRRRGQFRGPPPSFYRSGGWGAAGEKRRAHAAGDGRPRAEDAEARRRRQEEEYNADDSFARQQQGGGAGARGPGVESEAGGGGADEWPFSAPNDVRHFDRGGHFRRTSTVEEQLRRGRAKRRQVLMDEHAHALEEVGAGTEFRSFALISGVILVGIAVPTLFLTRTRDRRKKGA